MLYLIGEIGIKKLLSSLDITDALFVYIIILQNDSVQPLANSCSVWKLSDGSVPAHGW